jgi:hypothetical protein
VRAILWPVFTLCPWAHPANLVKYTSGESAALALFARSAWAQTATVLAGTTGEVAVLPCLRWSAWAQIDSVVAGTRVEGDALATVFFVGVATANNCCGGYDR